MKKESARRLDQATQNMIQQYETKYQKLTKELEETQRLLQIETSNKTKFETELKRVFLKNLTHMNMEAYALFNNGVPPQNSDMLELNETVEPVISINNNNNILKNYTNSNHYNTTTNENNNPQKVRFANNIQNKPQNVLKNKGNIIRGDVKKSLNTGVGMNTYTGPPIKASHPPTKKSTIITINNANTSKTSKSTNKSQTTNINNNTLDDQNVDTRASIENQIPRPYASIPTPEKY
eukprot:TRINITY_DN86732_c0_g1_i1.p1 TRINITY_DN86732_c0_g1~~TRINITY_DN86732_c0_g1_i1.p1  ORF type:complete len:271 (+),score=-14.13 TRINITY_DN86732_c0_g1_i1:108-815(+)